MSSNDRIDDARMWETLASLRAFQARREAVEKDDLAVQLDARAAEMEKKP